MNSLNFNAQENSDAQTGREIAQGQIRRVVDMDLLNDSRLVLVCQVNKEDDSAYVLLVNNLVEIATERDLLLPTSLTGASFELALYPDYKVRIWKEQILQSPIFGFVDCQKMSEIDAFQESQFQNQDKKGFKNSSLETGSFIPEFGDHVWKFRSNEIDAVNALGHFKNQQISTDRFQQKWKLRLEKENIWDVVIQEKMDIEEVYRNMLTNDAVRCERV